MRTLRMRADSKDREIDKIRYLIEKLRSITLTVQIIPFVYTAIYIIILCVYHKMSEPALRVVDSFFYISPVFVISLLIESRILKLCKWHRCASCIPMLPQVSVIADRYVELTATEYFISISIIITMSILLFLAAYNVFFKK